MSDGTSHSPVLPRANTTSFDRNDEDIFYNADFLRRYALNSTLVSWGQFNPVAHLPHKDRSLEGMRLFDSLLVLPCSSNPLPAEVRVQLIDGLDGQPFRAPMRSAQG
jgi:hypothetical protein